MSEGCPEDENCSIQKWYQKGKHMKYCVVIKAIWTQKRPAPLQSTHFKWFIKVFEACSPKGFLSVNTPKVGE